MRPTMVSVAVFLFGAMMGVKGFTEAEWSSTINLAGRQRMLSQRMSKEFLLIAKGVDVEANKQKLAASISLFDTTLNGLIDGDSTNNIIKAPSTLVADGLQGVKDLWGPFMALLQDNKETARDSNGQVDMDVLKVVAAGNIPVLKQSNVVVGRLVDASKAAGAATAGLVVDIAGRQRMLIQRMCKEGFLISLGIDLTANIKNLGNTVKLFGTSHRGIILGAEWAGVPALTDMCTLQQMRTVTYNWEQFKPLVDQILGQKTAQGSQAEATELSLNISASGDALFGSMVEAVKRFISNDGSCTEATLKAAITRSQWKYLLDNVGKQRFLGQQVSQLYMQIANDVRVSDSKVTLTVKLSQTDIHLRGLIEGSVTNQIPAPPTQKIADQLLLAYETWSVFSNAVRDASSDDLRDSLTVAQIADYSRQILEQINAATDMYEAEAKESMPSLPGYLINVAGRQRMLYQKMSKEASLVHYGEDPTNNWIALNATRELFTSVHWMLLHGVAATNTTPAVNKTTNICLIQHMKFVADRFGVLEQAALDTAFGTKVAIETLIEENPKAFAAMNQAVQWYATGPPESCEQPSVSFQEWAAGIMEVGKFRALTQKASAAFLLAASGTAGGQENLKDSIAELELSLRKLVYGSGLHQVPAPTDQGMLDFMFALEEMVPSFKDMLENGARRLQTGGAAVSTEGLKLLEEAEKRMTLYMDAASAQDPTVPVDRLNIASGQRLLAQKMFKEALLVRGGDASSLVGMDASIASFKKNHNALRNGGQGLKAVIPERNDLREQLEKVDVAWAAYNTEVQNLAEASGDSSSLYQAKEALRTLEAELDLATAHFGILDPYVPPKEPPFPWTVVTFVILGCLVLCVMVAACCAAGMCKASSSTSSNQRFGHEYTGNGSPSKNNGSPSKNNGSPSKNNGSPSEIERGEAVQV